ncbi:MAG: sulfotransferase family 2 domain-containing protein [Candidatus Omnitrophica bacterium]|nr:sulfotransferase family 2 domain-containing protein [Candidatus Omnitrophota bacterium]
MRISHKYKFIFFSNPRTGSESVRKALDPFSDIFSSVNDPVYNNHITPEELKNHFLKMGWDWDKYFKFCFVRNPWDRLVSIYYRFKPDKQYTLADTRESWDKKMHCPLMNLSGF